MNKRIKIVIVSVLLLCFVSSYTMNNCFVANAAACSLGDVDSNGVVNLVDVSLMFKAITKKNTFSTSQMNIGDIDRDGSLNLKDIALVFNAIQTNTKLPAVPTQEVTPNPEPSGDARPGYVWVSKTGSKYHYWSTCSNMNNPSEITLESAQTRGLTPCAKCVN